MKLTTWIKAAWATLGDKVRGTTPQAIIRQALDRIETADSVETARIRKQLEQVAVWWADGSPANPVAQTINQIDHRTRKREEMKAALANGTVENSLVRTLGPQAGGFEAEMLIRLRDWMRTQ